MGFMVENSINAEDLSCLQWLPQSLEVVNSRILTDKKKYAVYDVSVRWDDTLFWTVTHRFREFADLCTKLKKRIHNVPALPAKTYFFSNSLSDEFLTQRQQELGEMVQKMADTCVIAFAQEFRDFLEIEQHCPDRSVVPAPTCVSSCVDARFPVSDVLFDESGSWLLTTGEEVSMLSTVDSYITNARLPWESEGGPMVPLGSANFWKRSESGDLELKLTHYSRNIPITAVEWDPEPRVVYCGNADGSIVVLQVNEEFAEIEEITTLREHSQRIMTLLLLRSNGSLVSCSKDCTLSVFSLADQSLICKINLDVSLTDVIHDSAGDRLFVSDSYGQIHCLEVSEILSENTDVQWSFGAHAVSISTLSWIPDRQLLLSGSADCSVRVWDMTQINIEDHAPSEPIQTLSNGPNHKIRAVVYCSSVNQIVTGVEHGYLVVWCAKTWNAIHVLRPHEQSITKLIWVDSMRTLISASEDYSVKFMKFPHRMNLEIEYTSKPPQSEVKTTENVEEIKATEEKDDSQPKNCIRQCL
eukprot:214033_1